MQVTLEIPDDLAEWLASQGPDPARAALEALAIEGYRTGSLTPLQTRILLGFETRYEFETFLNEHQVWEHAYSLKELEQDRQTMRQLRLDGRLKVS
jgi:hypothetical protein